MFALLLACTSDPADSAAPVDAPSAVLEEPPVVFVGEEVTFDAGASAGATFTWDFGDGAVGEGATASHTYDAPGRYTVRLTATSSDGRTDTASAPLVAVYEPLATPPAASGRLALADGRLYAAVPDADVVVVVDATTHAVVERLATCGRPTSVSVAGGALFVACLDDEVQIWDTTTLALDQAAVLRWGARPTAIAATGEGTWVALAGTGEVLELGSGASVSAEDPGAIAVVGGATFVPRYRSPEAGGIVYAGASTWTLAADPGPDSDTDARGLPNLLGAVAVSPDGRSVIVGGSKANMDRGLYRDGLSLTHETTTRAALRRVDAASGAPLARALFDNRDRVGAVAFTPLGDKLLVAHVGAAVVDILDPVTLLRIGGFQSVGAGLDGVVSDGDTAWVLASLDRELVAYDLREDNAEIELARVALLDTELLSAELLLGAQVFHGAADPRMSTDAYVSCASCHPDGGTDARTWDFFDRGEGLRDTQALWAMPDAGPFHWSANFDELQDFENAIRAFQAGDGFMTEEDFAACEDPLGTAKAGYSAELDALAAYVRSLPVPRSPWRAEDGAWTEAAERGRLVFAAEGCAECHAGAETTDAGWDGAEPILHDVGTLLESSGGRAGGELTGLRTPSLSGLFASAPYLHDGRAATLEEALVAHGVSSDADLVRYLLEIEEEP